MSSTGATAGIRIATPADLPAIGELLSHRDETPWDATSVSWFTMGLDPDRCLCWLAFAGERPVGLSMMYVRTLGGPSGPQRAGYWANLYILPDFRDRLLYPRLPMAMFAALAPHRLAFLYTSVRLPELARAHTRLGFESLGVFPVLAKPLRPFSLVAKYKKLPPVGWIAPPLDALYGAWLSGVRPRAGREVTIEAFEPSQDPSNPLIDELVQPLMGASAGRWARCWTAETLRDRYERTPLRGRYGGRYQVLVTRRTGAFAGGLIYRVSERGEGIRAGVVMDAFDGTGGGEGLDVAIAEAERRSMASGAQVMLFMSGLGPALGARFERAGYRRIHEAYELMVWPKQALEKHPGLRDIERWSFAFRDHDAF